MALRLSAGLTAAVTLVLAGGWAYATVWLVDSADRGTPAAHLAETIVGALGAAVALAGTFWGLRYAVGRHPPPGLRQALAVAVSAVLLVAWSCLAVSLITVGS